MPLFKPQNWNFLFPQIWQMSVILYHLSNGNPATQGEKNWTIHHTFTLSEWISVYVPE